MEPFHKILMALLSEQNRIELFRNENIKVI